MKNIILILFVFLSSVVLSQHGKKVSYGDKLKESFLWADYEDGIYIGPRVGIEKYGLSVGGEIKFYAAYYYMPMASISFYGNYRRGLQAFRHNIPQNVIGIGAHLGIFGLEISSHFGDKAPLYKLIPKIGFDWANVSIFYGYDINLTKRKIPAYMNHSITVTYSFCFPTR